MYNQGLNREIRVKQKGKFMKKIVVAALIALLGISVYLNRTDAQAAEGEGADVAHGEYIVHSVAMCIQCHSPRDAKGRLNRSRLLRGAPIPVESPFPTTEWATRAPSIAGLPGYTEAEGVHFLTTGQTRRGDKPLAPMPPFRMSANDARDVVAYLKSIR